MLKRLTASQIQPEQYIVYVAEDRTILLGKVYGEVKQYGLLESMASDIGAEFDLLEAEQQGEAGQVFYETSIYQRQGAPGPGVYVWPEELNIPLTFPSQEVLRDFPGYLHHVQIKRKLDWFVVG
jgi:hypothetical protein